MNRKKYKSFALLILAASLVIGAFGCSTGAKLRGQAKEIEALNKEIHDRAYVCAPHELAVAESNVEFGLYELNQGDFTRAKRHIFRAEEHAKKADAMSDYEECLDQDYSVEVDTTPTVAVEREAREIFLDSDFDGIPDDRDQCPLEPEDFDGFEDSDGCPDPDNDGDGVLDTDDSCPNVAETQDGYQDGDGCPELDSDGDGILNINDQCPMESEDFDGFRDEDGCPDADNDGDGLIDILDKCPDEAGPSENDGCPVEEPKLVEVTDDRIELNEKVHFAYDKSEILPQSYPLLNEVAEVLEQNETIKVRIEGHTDSRGSDSYNKRLSQERADSVVQYLIGRGISASRMHAQGFGEERPIEDNATDAGRAANRRVEIHITER